MASPKFRMKSRQWLSDLSFWCARTIIFPIESKLNYRSWFPENPTYFLRKIGLVRLQRALERKSAKRRQAVFEAHGYPKISIIVAAYNAAQTIEQSISSLQAQRYINIEIVIIDDHSTDATPTIIKRMAAKDPRIVSRRLDENRGTSYCRNIGLTEASGDIVTFQDADDTSKPRRLGLQLFALLEKPGTKISLCTYVRVNKDGGRVRVNGRLVRKCIISMMFPREEVIDNVGFFRALDVSEDSDFYVRIKCHFGFGSETVIFKTLYHALLRPDSLLMSHSDIKTLDANKVHYQRDDATRQQWKDLGIEHKAMRSGKTGMYFPFQQDN